MSEAREQARFGRVAVLMGGPGAERPISLESGAAVAAALERQGVDATAIDWQGDLIGPLQRGRYERCFIALHGRGGEDGQVQGLLEIMGLPYTGSGVLGSALAMDKSRAKRLWQAQGLPTAAFLPLEPGFEPARVAAELGLPVMVKPAREGSSFGARVVAEAAALRPAYEAAASFDAEVIAERYIAGAEYTCSLLAGRALPLIRLETGRAFYDYRAKYEDEDTRYLCPCGLDEATEARYQALALEAFAALGGSGWGRVDFMVDGEGEVFLLEANTVPGMTGHSLVPMAAAAAGIDFDALVLRILAGAALHGPVAGGGAP